METKKESLRIKTFRLLRDRPASTTLKDIATASGLTESWVKNFHWRGANHSASVDKVEILYEYLTGKSLI